MDTRMRLCTDGIAVAVLCMENQSDICNIIPLRDMGYQYSNYREQVQNLKRQNEARGEKFFLKELGDGQKLMPVISLILYYGKDPWNGPESLAEMLDIPEDKKEKLAPWIQDHKVHIVHLSEQTEEIRKKYQSDFRHVADYLACRGDRNKWESYLRDETRIIRHPEEFLDVMRAFTSDRRFEQIKETVVEKMKENGVQEMEYISIAHMLEDRAWKKGLQEGHEEGRREGHEEGRREGHEEGHREGISQERKILICTMLRNHQTPEFISEVTEQPLEYVRSLQKMIVQNVE